MAMTLEHVRDWHRNRADGIRKGCTTGCSSKHDRMADAIDAHLSAQAKVRVSDADFECIKDTIRNHHLTYSRDDEGNGYPLIDALSVGHQTVKEGLEEVDLLADAIASALDDSFAARLSQGAQGEVKCHRCGATSETQAESMCIPDGDSCPGCEKPLSDQWKAERAAVPDEKPLFGYKNNSFYGSDASPSYAYACGWNACREAMLTAAPQPPEGARVVIDAKYDNVLAPFATLMARELHANAGKGDRPGWLKMSAATGMLEIYYHAAKLQKAVKNGDGDRIREYAADVANMSMMLLDVCGGLDVASPSADFPECSRNPLDCLENEGHGCCNVADPTLAGKEG